MNRGHRTGAFAPAPRRVRLEFILLLLALSPAAPSTPALAADAAQIRASAERLAAWAVEAGRPAVLASAIEALLAHGASLDPDDPWQAAELLRALERTPDGAPLAAAIRDRRQVRGRGVTSGVTRAELTLAPGASASFDLTFQARELAIVEVRLKRGSDLADVDLRLIDAAGGTLAADVGQGTGLPGYGLYVEWLPETCVTARAELSNAGSGDAHVVMLTQPSSRPQCGD